MAGHWVAGKLASIGTAWQQQAPGTGRYQGQWQAVAGIPTGHPYQILDTIGWHWAPPCIRQRTPVGRGHQQVAVSGFKHPYWAPPGTHPGIRHPPIKHHWAPVSSRHYSASVGMGHHYQSSGIPTRHETSLLGTMEHCTSPLGTRHHWVAASSTRYHRAYLLVTRHWASVGTWPHCTLGPTGHQASPNMVHQRPDTGHHCVQCISTGNQAALGTTGHPCQAPNQFLVGAYITEGIRFPNFMPPRAGVGTGS